MKDTKANTVELRLPVDAGYASVVRLLISGLSARLGLPAGEIENLKLVIGEAFLTITEKCERAAGLINLTWRHAGEMITISISDPSGKHKSVTSAANLALLKTLGGNYDSTVVDGVEHLYLNFEIKYREDRPFLFHDREDGRA